MRERQKARQEDVLACSFAQVSCRSDAPTKTSGTEMRQEWGSGPECTKIARFSAAAAAIFTAPQKVAIFWGPKMRDFLCKEDR